MATYYVTKVSDCEECHGNKVITHPAWARFFSKNFGKNLNHDEIVAWFENDLISEDEIPDQEIPCPECDGEGTFTEQANLLDALREITEEASIASCKGPDENRVW